jgi:3-methyl-2-oxobutanoate hydroxymethyltransferase
VLVLHDVLGLNGGKIPPFAKKFADVFELGVKGISDYIESMAKK